MAKQSTGVAGVGIITTHPRANRTRGNVVEMDITNQLLKINLNEGGKVNGLDKNKKTEDSEMEKRTMEKGAYCKVFTFKKGKVLEQIQTVRYDYSNTPTAIHVTRHTELTEARPVVREDLRKLFLGRFQLLR